MGVDFYSCCNCEGVYSDHDLDYGECFACHGGICRKCMSDCRDPYYKGQCKPLYACSKCTADDTKEDHLYEIIYMILETHPLYQHRDAFSVVDELYEKIEKKKPFWIREKSTNKEYYYQEELDNKMDISEYAPELSDEEISDDVIENANYVKGVSDESKND